MEKVYFNSKNCINKDEEVLYRDKDIHINGTIYCKGTLRFERCRIYYGNIEFNRHRQSDFIRNIAIQVVGGKVYISNCEIIEITGHDTAFISDFNETIRKSSVVNHEVHLHGRKNADNQQVIIEDSCFSKSSDLVRKLSLKNKDIFYISVNKGLSVSRCTFLNMSYCFIGNGNVSDNKFYGCKYIYQQTQEKKIIESNSLYDRCKHVSVDEYDFDSFGEFFGRNYLWFVYIGILICTLIAQALCEYLMNSYVGREAVIRAIVSDICLSIFIIPLPVAVQGYLGMTVTKLKATWSVAKSKYIALGFMYFICWGIMAIMGVLSMSDLRRGPVCEDVSDYQVVIYDSDDNKYEVNNVSILTEDELDDCYLEFNNHSLQLDMQNMDRCMKERNIKVYYYEYLEILMQVK